MEDIDTKIDDLRAEMQKGFADSKATTQGGLDDFRAYAEFADARLRKELKGEMKQGFAAMDQRFSQIDQRFNQVDQRFNQIDQRFNRLERRFDRLEERLFNDKPPRTRRR